MKKLLAALAATAVLLGAGGYFGKKYFDEHYVLLSQEEAVELLQYGAQMGLVRGYQIGRQACEKSV